MLSLRPDPEGAAVYRVYQRLPPTTRPLTEGEPVTWGSLTYVEYNMYGKPIAQGPGGGGQVAT